MRATARLAPPALGADALAARAQARAPLPLSKIDVAIAMDLSLPGFIVEAVVRTEGRTGVEMEALTAVSVACLTLFDMLKAADKGMTIGEIRVTEKEGGASGAWQLPR